jgi:hypothetical protein
MPSAYTWAQAVDGNWFDASRWKDQNNQPGVPGCGDDATIGSGAVTVTIAGNACAHKLTDSARLVVPSGGLAVGVSSSTGELDLKPGTVLSLPDNSTVTLGNGSVLEGTVNVGALSTLGLGLFTLTGTVNNPAGSLVYFIGINGGMLINPGAQLAGAGEYRVVGNTYGGPFLTFNADTAVQNFTVDTNGGVTGPNKLTVTQTLSWVDGTMSGTGSTDIAAGAALSLSGSVHLDTRTVNNYGTAIWVQGSPAQVSSATGTTAFNNYGTANVQNDGWYYFQGYGAFNNFGTLTKTSSSGLGTTHSGGTFNNSGTVNAVTGTIEVAGGASTGTFNATGGTILFSGWQSYVLNAGAQITGPGFTRMTGSNGVLNVNASVPAGNLALDDGKLYITAGSTLTVSSHFELNGGTVSGPGAMTFPLGSQFAWNAGNLDVTGTTTIQPRANAYIQGTGIKNLLYGTLQNSGGIFWTGSKFEMTNGAVVNSSGFIYLQSDTSSGYSGVTLNNSGRITKTSPGTMSLSGITLNNTGSVSVASGVLEVFGGTSSNVFNVSSGATLRVPQNGSYTLAAGAKLLGGGIYQVSTGSGGTLTVNGDVSVKNLELNVNGTVAGTAVLTVAGAFDWIGGSISNSAGSGVVAVADGWQLNIKGNADKNLVGKTLNIAGIATWRDGGNLVLSAGASIIVAASGSFGIQNDRNVSGSGLFSNKGSLSKAASIGLTTIASAVSFTNDGGSVDVVSGMLQIDKFTQNAGATTVAPGATLKSAGTVTLEGGSLSGTGVVQANVLNDQGTVRPGGDGVVGKLTVDGSYTQKPLGKLALDVSGQTAAGVDYDWLAVTGAVTLAGTLDVNFQYGPAVGDSYKPLTGASVAGTFDTINANNLGSGKQLTAAYDPADVTLTVVSGTSPGSSSGRGLVDEPAEFGTADLR